MAANLTFVAIAARKTIRYSIYGLIAILVLRSSLMAGLDLYKKYGPKAVPKPTAQFGPLPQLPFPKAAEELPQFSYTVETPTGSFDQFPTIVNVYFMPKFITTLYSADDSNKKAKALGFSGEPSSLTETVYRYTHPKFPAILDMNIASGVFSLSYNLAADSTPLQGAPLTNEKAASIAQGVLTSIEQQSEDLPGNITFDYLKLEQQNLSRAASLSEADLIKVNIFRKNIKQIIIGKEYDIQSMPPNPKEANIWFIVSKSGNNDQQIVGAEYHYYPIDQQHAETYPIKTAAQALEELKGGKGYIANLGLNKDGKVTIRRAYLAYYDPNVQTDFFQPIIVFQGDDDFYAYVPAVTDEYYGK